MSKEGISGGRNRSKVAGTEEGMMEDGGGEGIEGMQGRMTGGQGLLLSLP